MTIEKNMGNKADSPNPKEVMDNLGKLEKQVQALRQQVRDDTLAAKKPAPEGYHYMPDGKLMRDDGHDSEAAVKKGSDDPCWEGYVQLGTKMKNGKEVPNCVPKDAAVDADLEEVPEGFHRMPDGEIMRDDAHDKETELSATDTALAAKKRTKAQTPAPKKDRISGSKKNRKGSAGDGKKVTFSKAVIAGLENKVANHNKTASKGRRATLSMLKAAYRRGAGAFSTSYRPGQNRNSWAMGRVNAFLRLLKSGKPSKAAYTQDNDLLPASHPRSTKKGASVESLLASGMHFIPEEADLVKAIYEVVQKHGKFDQDGDGVWAGYTPSAQNDVASIGVKCSNCVFYQGGDQCAIIALSIDEDGEGKCRFAMLPEGAVQGNQIPLRDPADLELLLASAVADYDLLVSLPSENTFETVDEAVLALTEYSGFGYEAEFAIRASWLRAVANGEDPYRRAKSLAVTTYDSLDADLLPKEAETDD